MANFSGVFLWGGEVMLQTIIMHGIAGGLWVVALFMAWLMAFAIKESIRDVSRKAFALMLLSSILAFTLQVLA